MDPFWNPKMTPGPPRSPGARPGRAIRGALRGAPLPAPGGEFRYFYLTHVSIVDEDPGTMAALLDRIYDDHHGHYNYDYSVANGPAGKRDAASSAADLSPLARQGCSVSLIK